MSTPSQQPINPNKLNINIGILGHVDSGKTSIARALSTHFSTASIDKSPQESERGITIELGFSCFGIPLDKLPNKLRTQLLPLSVTELQFTLVDCPGHSSLIRTIIGGANIIDFMLLVIDINKGIQTQTAECLVLGEILTKKTQICVILNKMDLFQKKYQKNNNYKQKLNKKINSIKKVFKKTKFGSSINVICITANCGGSNVPGKDIHFDHNLMKIQTKTDGIQILINKILNIIEIPNRYQQSLLPLLGAVDHCFSIKGQGTILTLTILRGTLLINQVIEIPNYKQLRKVKSMQMYGQSVKKAITGDRVSISITQFQSSKLNRGLICSPNTIPTIHRCIARCDRIRFFKEAIKTNSKFHITIGHSTTIAHIICFRKRNKNEIELHKSDEINMIKYKNDNKDNDNDNDNCDEEVIIPALDWNKPFNFNDEYLHLDTLDNIHNDDNKFKHISYETYILLTFSVPVCASPDSLLIGSRFDNANCRKDLCRLGFCGKIVSILKAARIISLLQWKNEQNINNDKIINNSKKNNIDASLQKLLIYKPKLRIGNVSKFIDGYTCIGTNMFKKGTDISLFKGLKVELQTKFHEVGTITGSFGDSGNFYVKFKNKVKRKKSDKWKPKILLKSKKFIFQKYQRMTQ